MNKFVVYTVIVGDYDELKQPLVVDERFDYILFTDNVEQDRIGIWQVRSIEYKTNKNYLKARYPRLNPEIVLPEYDAWLYHDGTMQIQSSMVYEKCVQYYKNGIEWVGVRHHCRNNVFEEISTIILDRDKNIHDYDCVDWYWHTKQQGYPTPDKLNGNLIETGLIFRIKTHNVQKVNNYWWESLEKYSVHRDQFSLPFALWRVPSLKFDYFLSKEENLWNNPYVVYAKHIGGRGELVRSMGETIRYRCWRVSNTGELYTQVFDNAYRVSSKHPHIALNLYTLFMVVRYGGLVLKEMIKCRIQR